MAEDGGIGERIFNSLLIANLANIENRVEDPVFDTLVIAKCTTFSLFSNSVPGKKVHD